MFFKFFAFSTLISVGVYFYFNSPLLLKLATGLGINLGQWSVLHRPPQETAGGKEILFSVDELKKYDGREGSRGLYVCVLGRVYDVSKGAKHYKPGGSYDFFAGRDASRAYVTGDFTPKGLIDDVDDFSLDQLESLQDWVGSYDSKYVFKGKLIGRFYDKSGNPTAAMKEIQKKLKEGEVKKAEAAKDEKRYPPCNVEWSKESGRRYWCTSKSGGVVRDWAGVPRQYFSPNNKSPRCACVNIESEGETAIAGGRFQLYEGCPPESASCSVPADSEEK